ncbi:MAG: MarR family transcriptional regulator [SAR116 cluster bacterium]|nr:MAG: MarR family transcriptional regulator [SAR116 cluster bacterium]
MTEAPRYDDSLTIALLRARDAVTAQFRDHVGEAGLTLQQWRVIRALAGGAALDTTTLAKSCVILAPSLTRIVRHLGDLGLVEQVPSRDRRQRVIKLTPQGEALFTDIWQVSQRKYAAIEDAFGSEELHDLVVSLNRLRACLEIETKTEDRVGDGGG